MCRSCVLDVLEYWVNLVGVDRVALALHSTEDQSQEWAGWMMLGKRRDVVLPLPMPVKMPESLTRADEMPNITAGLLRRGYVETDVKQILGLNVLRLFEKRLERVSRHSTRLKGIRELYEYSCLTG